MAERGANRRYQGDYLWLANASTHYSASSNGSPILSRPFYDLSPTQADPSMIVGQNVENVAAPGIIAGSVSVDAQTVFQTGGLRALLNLCCSQQCYSNSFLPGLNGPGARRVDLLIGYRYGRLNDSLAINENLTSLESTEPGSFHVNDSFATRNVFNGVELGTSLQNYRGRWSLEMVMKMALGNTLQSVDINGYTTTTQNGSSTTDPGGLLAQSTNIGHYSRNQMAVMPQLGANLGYQLTPRLRVLAGYTFLYWSNVVRAGNQIDFDVNSRLLPNDTRPLAGDTQHPQFAFQTSDFWRKVSMRASTIAGKNADSTACAFVAASLARRCFFDTSFLRAFDKCHSNHLRISCLLVLVLARRGALEPLGIE